MYMYINVHGVTVCVGGGGDSLDEYMSVVSSQLDPATIMSLKQQVLELKKVC